MRSGGKSRTSTPNGVRPFCVFVVLAALLLPCFTFAAEPSPYGKIRLGPVFMTPRLTLTAGVDDNVYNSDETPIAD
jgi:hypothetical protein